MYTKNACEVYGAYRLDSDGVEGKRLVTADYIVVDPLDIKAKLETAGFQVYHHKDLMDGSRWSMRHRNRDNPALQALVAMGPGRGATYRSVAILLPNTGDCSIRLMANVVRPICTNMFPHAKAKCIRHDSWKARAFLFDPVPWVREVFRDNEILEESLEISMSYKVSEDLLLNSLAFQRPRIAHKLSEALAYTPEYQGTMWRVLQGLTEPKLPSWQKAASTLLDLLYRRAIDEPQEIMTRIILDI